MLIAGALEVDNGIDNLWKRGDSKGWKTHANFGQFIPKGYFKAFMTAFPYLWADKKYWYRPLKDMPWDLILPFLKEYNNKRNHLLWVLFLILDESMSGFCPKTTAYGDLPNISHEPRKPVSLGTMLRNAVEGRTGIFAFHDIVQDLQSHTQSHMPKGEPILSHVAECLRQAEGAGLQEGGWLGGDAWFGSLNCCVELKKKTQCFLHFHHQTAAQLLPQGGSPCSSSCPL